MCTARLPYNDGCPAWTSTFIEYMNERLDKDYSYLYTGSYFHKDTDKWWPQIDHNFTMDCFEYFEKNNMDVNSLTNNDIPSLSTLSQGYYHQCAFDFAYPKGIVKDYLLINDEINLDEFSIPPKPTEKIHDRMTDDSQKRNKYNP